MKIGIRTVDDRNDGSEKMRALIAALPNRASGSKSIDEAAEVLPESQRQEAKTFGEPWFRTVLRLDPAALHRGANVPTLALFGALDRQVAAVPDAEAARALPHVEVRVVDGANHLFQGAKTGAVAEYRAIEETMNEDVMKSVADWVKAR